MKELPNGLTIFNATPHSIRFWREDWDDVIIVDSDVIISASPLEIPVISMVGLNQPNYENIWVVRTKFQPNKAGWDTIENSNADVIIGSIIAAQAYPGKIFAMIPCKGFERVPPAEKRMRPDKFTTF